MLRQPILATFILALVCSSSFADEGMWMPNKLQLKDSALKAAGLKIPVEEIYSEVSPSLKDAVVLFGSGCTGEIISDQGLVLTNHHCGFSQIQSLSTVANNYVEKGFWASDKSQEIPCPGLTITFIKRIEDVTGKILPRVDTITNQEERTAKIKELISTVEKEAMKETVRKAVVRSFYDGNKYFLFVSETFRDIRLAGAPPVSIGKYGVDTDNWTWPRHTGDFSVFRIYADSSNQPADYSPGNVPLRPVRSFTLSLRGVKEGDFTMAYGFPGTTTEYLPSYAVELVQTTIDPARVNIREKKLAIWKSSILKNDTLQLMYSSKYATIANYWKKWKGEMLGLRKSNVVAEKKDYEKKFLSWMNGTPKAVEEYSGVLHEMELFYAELQPYARLNEYYTEAILGIEVFGFLNTHIRPLVEKAAIDSVPDDSLSAAAARLLGGVPGFFKNYDAPTDERLMAAMLELYHDSNRIEYHPDIYMEIASKYKGDYARYSAGVYSGSVFASEQSMTEFLSKFDRNSVKKLEKDPAWQCYSSFTALYRSKVQPVYTRNMRRIEPLQRKYMKAQMEMHGEDNLYPDANRTLRVTYGQVAGYSPADAVHYGFQTTLDGVLDKYIPGDYEFDLPEKLLQLCASKDYGGYTENGKVPVSFIADNHTTGGNSGSPVINANGELIGTNYDRVWEGTLSDFQFDENLCRNISLDIRYTLFLIEKLGGAKNLIDEMKIVR